MTMAYGFRFYLIPSVNMKGRDAQRRNCPYVLCCKDIKVNLHQVHQENHFLDKSHNAVYEHMEFYLKICGSGLSWRLLTLVA